jgi:hypothetical protein
MDLVFTSGSMETGNVEAQNSIDFSAKDYVFHLLRYKGEWSRGYMEGEGTFNWANGNTQGLRYASVVTFQLCRR